MATLDRSKTKLMRSRLAKYSACSVLSCVAAVLMAVPIFGQTATVTLVGAGDIAKCDLTYDEQTAQLIGNTLASLSTPAQVITLGDNAYMEGNRAQFANCYDNYRLSDYSIYDSSRPAWWGQYKDLTMPSLGNHEYHNSTDPTLKSKPYFDYFGAQNGFLPPTAPVPSDSPGLTQGKGYYSYDLGSWHIVVLNSNDHCMYVSCAADSAQASWLQNDLATHPAQCTLAYIHHPLYATGTGGRAPEVKPLVQVLYDHGADVMLNGHNHRYERLARIDPDGNLDSVNGIRMITAGTGGWPGEGTNATPPPSSEVRIFGTAGILRMDLSDTSYSWQFIAVDGTANGTVMDSSSDVYGPGGSEPCHGAPDTTPPDSTIDSGPSGIEKTGDASFTFSSTESNSTFECSLDGATFSTCSSPQPYNELADGSHTFEVRATDAAGNLDPTPASYTWTVDTAAPSAAIDINGGDAYTYSTTVNLTLNADDPSPGSGVAEMRFSDDGTTWSEWELFATNKTWTVSGGDGEKIVYVQFRDAAGNESATAQDTISLETVDPTTTHTLSPAPNASGWNNSDVSVTLNATDNGGSGVKQISYSVNGGEPITVQQNSVQIPVTDEGETTISYHATDNAGNAEAQQTFTVKIDKSAPDATITSGPSGPTNDTTPTFSFGGSDNLTASSSLLFSYKVVADGVAPESVAWSDYSASTSATLGDTTGLGEDSYIFYVKVKDQAGNEDASPAQRSFTVDTTAPTVKSVTPPNNTTGVAPGINVTATFFEQMNRTTIRKSTFKLYKVNPDGTTTRVTNVTVKLSADGLKATLNPFGTSSTVLERNIKYRAVITASAQDFAGNPLAAKKVWSFTTR